MRNPFARLAKRDAARPSLRERAATLKASAARVIRRKSVDTVPAAPGIALAADPVLAAIAATRRLTAARARAAALPQPAGTTHVLPEQEAATDAFYAHVDDVLVKTVPTTAAGCTALARYALEFLETEEFALDEDANNEPHVRILGLIARSPMLDGGPPVPPLVPDFSGYTVADLRRTYDAFKLATDIMGLSEWAFDDISEGHRLLDAECDRLSFFQGYIADELKRRECPEKTEATWRIDTLIGRAVACGDYKEATRFASEADAKRL